MKKRLAFALLLPLLLAACGSLNMETLKKYDPFASFNKVGIDLEGPGPASRATGLAPQAARLTDETGLSDRITLNSVQLRLRKLSESGVPQRNYSLAKAQCWLDSAKTQYMENDRTGYIEEALSESDKIARALEADRNARAGNDTPLIANSRKLRDDLWQALALLKNQSPDRLACLAQTVACAEVRLVRAGHAEQQTGWRAATPYVLMVEDAIRRAQIEGDNCTPPAALVARAPASGASAATAGTAAAGATVTQVITRENFLILSDTLFQFDKSGVQDMLPGGRERLRQIADRLKSFRAIQSLRIVGHTDRLGSDDYNDVLSAARAKTVRDHLESLGVKAASVESLGRGKREPVTTGCSDRLPREQLIQCLQADRRVAIEVTGVVR